MFNSITFFLLCFVLFASLIIYWFLIKQNEREEIERIGNIASSSATDVLYDAPTDDDKIGFNVYAYAFSEKIKATNAFMVYGIYGAWGSGKTSLLKMIDSNLPDTKRIWFDAWKYKRKVSIFDALCQVMGSELKDDISNYSIKNKAAEIVGFSKKKIESVRYDALKIDTFEKNIKAVVNYINMDHNNKIVVFVDDLDRCDPAEAMDFMEKLKVFFDIPRLAFVIGVNYEVLFSEINRRYSKTTGKEAYTEEYLAKVINFPFFIPRLDRNTIKKYIKDNIKIKEVQDAIDVFTVGNDGSLRSLKRMVNVYTLLLSIVKQKRMKLDAVILAKMLVIQLRYRETYNKALLNENYIISIQNSINIEHNETARRRRLEINKMDLPDGLKEILRLDPPFPKNEIRKYISFVHSEDRVNEPGKDLENAYLDLIKHEKFDMVYSLQVFSRKLREDVVKMLIENFDKYSIAKKKEIIRLLITPFTDDAKEFLTTDVLNDKKQPPEVKLYLVESLLRKEIDLEAYSRGLTEDFSKKNEKEQKYVIDEALTLIRGGKKYGVDILGDVLSSYDISLLSLDTKKTIIQLLGDSGDQKAIDIIELFLRLNDEECVDYGLEAVGKLNLRALIELYEVYMYSQKYKGAYISSLSHHIMPNSSLVESISVDIVINYVMKVDNTARIIDGLKLLQKIAEHYILENEDIFSYDESVKINSIINPIVDTLTSLARHNDNWQVRDTADMIRKEILNYKERHLLI